MVPAPPDKCNLGRKRPGDPYKYLLWLREQTATIDIRGLQVGSDKAHNFPIRDLYIPLTTAAGAGHLEEGDDERGLHREPERRVVDLDTALRHRRLVIVGDPGAGKTTFLRRLAFELAEGRLKAPQVGAGASDVRSERTGPLYRMLAWFREAAARPPFPVFIRIDGFARHIRAGNNGPADRTAPRWIPHYLAARAHDLNWDLDEDFFRDRLASGEAMVPLDGLDEAPDQAAREDMARLLEQATQAWTDCQFIITTRPAAYSGLSTLRDFEHARIEPLQPEAIHQFLQHWCRCLYPDSPGEAERHLKELEAALRMSTAIRGMASNPVMLTALAVLHWNDRRLPQQRAELYESVLVWLARSREIKPGRESWERFLLLLQHLGLAMQSGDGGRKVQVSKGAAADILAGRFTELPRDQQRQRALDFLTQEEADSGIIVSRDTDVRFWHLTFQEHLAARAIAGLPEGDQAVLLLDGGRIYQQEWREVALLLAGVLRVKQGPDKVDVLVKAVLDHLGSSAPLAERARCVGLIGAIVRDLRPFDYQPADPRYSETLASVVEIFDSEKASEIDLRIRLEAAEALGQAGDPRLERENWVRIGNFEIGRYPVTVQEYRRFVEAGGYENEAYWGAGGFGIGKEPEGWEGQLECLNRPVVGVSWYEAAAYSAWAGCRLPSEAEWGFAARGKEARKYPWGNQVPDESRANYRGAGPGRPTPVGLYPKGATPEGLQDMAGNVWEWVADWVDERKKERVLRGGSFSSSERNLRAANRINDEPERRNDLIGFRCVRELNIP